MMLDFGALGGTGHGVQFWPAEPVRASLDAPADRSLRPRFEAARFCDLLTTSSYSPVDSTLGPHFGAITGPKPG